MPVVSAARRSATRRGLARPRAGCCSTPARRGRPGPTSTRRSAPIPATPGRWKGWCGRAPRRACRATPLALLRDLAAPAEHVEAQIALSRFLASSGALEDAARVAFVAAERQPSHLRRARAAGVGAGRRRRPRPAGSRWWRGCGRWRPTADATRYYTATLLFMEGRTELAIAEARTLVAGQPYARQGAEPAGRGAGHGAAARPGARGVPRVAAGRSARPVDLHQPGAARTGERQPRPPVSSAWPKRSRSTPPRRPRGMPSRANGCSLVVRQSLCSRHCATATWAVRSARVALASPRARVASRCAPSKSANAIQLASSRHAPTALRRRAAACDELRPQSIRREGERHRNVAYLSPDVSGTELARRMHWGEQVMSVVKLLGFGTLACGCVVGRYRDVASTREVVYVEEKGPQCASASHRQNHTISALARRPHGRRLPARRRRQPRLLGAGPRSSRRRGWVAARRRRYNSPACPPASPRPTPPSTLDRPRLTSSSATASTYFPRLPAHSLDVVVTSPPYNLGVRYRTYDDGRPREDYLDWTSRWVAGVARTLDRARLAVPERRRQADRPLDRARRGAGGAAASAPAEHHPLDQVDRHRTRRRRRPRRPRPTTSPWATTSRSTRPGSSTTATSSCSTSRPHGTTPLDRLALGVKYQDASNVGALASGAGGPALPRQHLVHALRDHPEPRQRPAPPGHVPAEPAGVLRPAARPGPRAHGRRSVPRPGLDDRGLRAAGRERRRHRARRALPQGSDRPHRGGACARVAGPARTLRRSAV